VITDAALARAEDLADCLPETPDNYMTLRALRRILHGQECNPLAIATKKQTTPEE
jgi:hypothetical protein